jgi:hypothetical protein
VEPKRKKSLGTWVLKKTMWWLANLSILFS